MRIAFDGGMLLLRGTSEDIDLGADWLFWFKTDIYVYDAVDLAEEYAV